MGFKFTPPQTEKNSDSSILVFWMNSCFNKYTYTCIHIYMGFNGCLSTLDSPSHDVYVYIYIHTCLYLYTYIYTYVHKYGFKSAYIYVYMYVYASIYTCI